MAQAHVAPKEALEFGRFSFQTGSGATFGGLFSISASSLRAMSAILETLRYQPNNGVQGSTTNLEDLAGGTEGKFGIPRFNGDPTLLAEYTYRVNTRIAKEAKMEKTEVDKLGPLGLRLVEGLRGQAFRLAQQIEIAQLAASDGPKKLLQVFHDSLKPRKTQEARELYAAGSKEGGMLSRQHGEPMSSYIARRRAWWMALNNLDAELKIPDVILAEQILTNAGISDDQRLMIRTMLHGDVTVDKVASELLSQHPNIHEKEKNRGYTKGHGKPWKKNSWRPRGFHAEMDLEDDWETRSQSLTGYTAVEDSDYFPEETYDNYSYEAVGDQVLDDEEDGYLVMNFAMICENGFDMANEEACALAAESLQLEQEAYFVRNQGKGKGHGGFQPHRSFDISGQVSFQERKARLAQLKAKTECRRCGAKGHWSGDPQCPKSPRKSFGGGARKGSSSTSKGSSSTSAGGGKRDGKQKPRVVYFSMGEEKPEDQGPVQRFAGMALERGGAQVPPPSSLSSPMRLSSAIASSSTSSMAAAPQVGQPGFLGLLDQETLQRAQQLREVSRMQAQQQHHAVVHSPQQDPSAEDMLLRRALDQGVALQQQDPVLGAVFNVLANMEVDEEADQPVASSFEEIEVVKGVTSYEIADVYGQEPLAPGHVRTSEGYVVPVRDAATTEARHRYLDEYLEKVPQDQRDTAEYRDAYQERWSEFVPGHPLFTESDAANLQRWNQKQLQGEPRLPDSRPTPPLPAAAVLQTSGPMPSSTTTAVAVVASGGGCEHKRITKKGTNKYYYMETCLDCHKVIKKEPKEQPKATSVSTTSTRTTPSTCEHHNVSWQGSNGHQWKNTCKDCGFSTSGFYRDGQSGIRRPGAKTRSSKPSPGQPSLQPIGNSNKAAQMFHTCMVVASVMGDQEGAAELGPGDLHRILDAVIAGTSLTTTSTKPSPSGAQPRTDPDSLGSHPKDYKVVNFGEYKGRTFAEAYGSPGYVKWCEENVCTDSCRGLKELCEYFRQKKREKTHTTYMAIEDDNPESSMPEEPDEIHSETDLIAILDLGCNKTCHGEKWLRRFQIATSTPEIPLDDQCSTSFKGIGGIVNTNGVRHMNVCFELEDGGLAVGDLKSTELKDSEAPLLLSIADQRKLGLSVQLADTGDKVFSSRLNGYLKVAEINGLLGIRLIPSELALLTLGASPDGVDHAPATMEDTEQSPTSTAAPMTSASSPDLPVPEETETFLIIEDEPRKTLTRNQKKYLESSINEVKAADWGLWSTLRKDQHPPLPKGCKVFLMEIFAGAAVLTSLALSMQLPVAAPVDIKIDGTDLLNPKVRARIEEDIERLDPFCLTFAPECAPWGSWSRLNMTRSPETHDYIQGQRDAWYPCLQWVKKIIKQRLARGRKVLLENPWGSELWSTLCISKLITEGPIDSETLEPLELVRGDQCSFGLRDHQTGDLHYKPTGFLTASKPVKLRLQQRCDGLHTHQPLEGGSRTKKAQQWPVLLCKAMLHGFLEELQERTMNAAFHVEANMEEELEQPKEFDLGTLDYIHNEQDMARTTATSTAIDDHELQRQEQMEEMDSPTQLMEVEVERKRKWLQVPKDIRIALRRLHHMTGHGSSASMLQLLRTAGASPKALEASRHFACETCRKRQPTQRPPTVKEPSKLIFNHEVSVDCFEIHDSAGNRHTVLSMLCLGTLFHQAWWVATGGVPRSGVCAEMILNGWLQPYGAPQFFTCDREVHNQGRVKDLLRIHGIQLRYAGLEAPYQIGRTERQGGIFKEILKAAIEERQIIGVQDIKMLISEVAMVKNCRINHHGFTPIQWVLGKLPREVTSLTSEHAEGQDLGVQEEVQEPEDVFSRQLEIRQAAKVAFAKADSSRRIRAALLRKAVPLRGPYVPGDLVCFHRRGRWHGPGRIIGREGRSTLWVVHGGIPIVVAENQLRPATTSEVLAKQVLELRPVRKRKRELTADVEVQETPFVEDLMVPGVGQEEDQQPSYIDLPSEPGPAFGPQPAVPEDQETPQLPDQAETVNDLQMMEDQEVIPVPVPLEQPESEAAPSRQMTEDLPEPPVGQVPQHPPGLGDGGLTAALRRSVDQLDGIPRPATPYPRTTRSRSPPARDPVRVPIPEDEALFVKDLQYRQSLHFYGFLARRVFKKKRQTGAGRELNFNKSEDKVKQELEKSRLKEWNNWKQFSAVKIIPPDEVEEVLKNNPEMEILPTRWVDTDKAEVNEDPIYKSRLVARGDLERNNNLRTDSPTSSQLFLNLIISFSACTKQPLRGGDISAAFLQGTGITRMLALKLPDGGVPDDDVAIGSLMLCEKSVYGTRDAPRGFWKGLHDSLIQCGLKEICTEASAYFLPGEPGHVRGLLGTHVDDLLWCGGKEMDQVMSEVQKHYNFRTTASEEFKFCGRIIKQQKDGLYLTCPSVLDRTKAIYVHPSRKGQRAEAATPQEVSQLRSVVGSLSWLARVCRPDLSFQVNQLQSFQQNARVEDLIVANKLLSYALKTKERGIYYASGEMNFDEAVILCINDASFGASVEATGEKTVSGHRSQSGRILALAHPDFIQSGVGRIHMLQWTSSVIKRVCRSTLQSETMSLQLGAEEAEHVRQLLHVVKNLAVNPKPIDNLVPGMDHLRVIWYTDCRSLSDHLQRSGSSDVNDKRLAIDLTSLRQDLWRGKQQLVGNPVYEDQLPSDRTLDCRWVDTATMLSDGLTKHMKCSQLIDTMTTGWLQFQFKVSDGSCPEENTGV